MHKGTPPPPDIWPLHPSEAQLPHHQMLWVEAGSLMMGNNDKDAIGDEKIIHKVTLQAFCMARSPVTQMLYMAVMEVENPSRFPGEDRPVENVSWDDAQQFIQKLNEKTGRTNAKWQYRLPSEAQWEYAAKGGPYEMTGTAITKYSGSNKLKEVGWYDKNSHGETKPVGMKIPNQLGLFDMTGNVWEWCEDDWHDSYENAPDDGSAWVDTPERGSFRVRRGGSWHLDPHHCRPAYRSRWLPDSRDSRLGFRLCLVFSEVGVFDASREHQ